MAASLHWACTGSGWRWGAGELEMAGAGRGTLGLARVGLRFQALGGCCQVLAALAPAHRLGLNLTAGLLLKPWMGIAELEFIRGHARVEII